MTDKYKKYIRNINKKKKCTSRNKRKNIKSISGRTMAFYIFLGVLTVGGIGFVIYKFFLSEKSLQNIQNQFKDPKDITMSDNIRRKIDNIKTNLDINNHRTYIQFLVQININNVSTNRNIFLKEILNNKIGHISVLTIISDQKELITFLRQLEFKDYKFQFETDNNLKKYDTYYSVPIKAQTGSKSIKDIRRYYITEKILPEVLNKYKDYTIKIDNNNIVIDKLGTIYFLEWNGYFKKDNQLFPEEDAHISLFNENHLNNIYKHNLKQKDLDTKTAFDNTIIQKNIIKIKIT